MRTRRRLAFCAVIGAAALPATDATAATKPANTSLPTISGPSESGSLLTAGPGTWTGTTPLTYTYSWRRCTTTGGSCKAITGATAATYRLTSTDVGKTVRVAVTGRNSAGTATATSVQTAVVSAVRLVVQKNGFGAAESLIKSQSPDSAVPPVYRDDGRINCGSDCSDASNAKGRLIVDPSPFSRWSGWTGACLGSWLDCDFAQSAGTVSVTATFAPDGRTQTGCDGVVPASFSPPATPFQLTATTDIGTRVDWLGPDRIAYAAFRAPWGSTVPSPVLLLDRDGSCGLGSATEKLFHNAADAAENRNAEKRYHQPGLVAAPNSNEGWGAIGLFSFSPDGSRIAYASGGRIHVADAATGLNDELLGYTNESHYVAIDTPFPPVWSPDGSKITFDGMVVKDGVWNSNYDRIVVYPGQGPQYTVVDIDGDVCSVWKTSDTLYARPAKRPGTNEPNDQLGAVDVAGGITLFGRHQFGNGCPTSRAANGRIVYMYLGVPRYHIVADSTNSTTLSAHSALTGGTPVLSPDGSKLAWLDDGSGTRELVVADANGGLPTSVATMPEAFGLAWSPDSDEIAFVRTEGGSRQVFTVKPNALPPTLLQRYAPELRHDSQEVYRPDSAATITDSFVENSHTNRLIDASGTTIAASDRADPAATLSLAYLGPTYPGFVQSSADDYLDEASDTRDADAQRMHSDARYADRIYGRAVPAAGGGKLLQYWFWYYNNPKTFYTAGDHEGDWEMIQLRLDGAGAPVGATYAQHKRGEYCTWDRVARTANGRPIVYIAHESHASYFSAGEHTIIVNGRPDQTDFADGNGEAIVPTVIDVTSPPSWMEWGGKWGGAEDSPVGPMHQPKWDDLLTFESTAFACTAPAGNRSTFGFSAEERRQEATGHVAPPAPKLDARRVGNRIVIDYRFAVTQSSDAEPWLLVTTVDGRVDGYTPTSLRTLLRGARRGRIVQPLGLARGPIRVLASTRARDGARSAMTVVDVRS